MNESPQILVVDDEPLLLQAAFRLLSKAGYRVLKASTGKEAWQLAQRHQPDLILLDVVLPDVSGLEICRRIKADEQLARCFVTLLSGLKVESDERAEGLESGADDYLIRPIANRELLARVRSMLRIKLTEDALRQERDKAQKYLDIAGAILVVIDADQSVSLINQKGCQVLGCQEAKILGQNWFDRFVPPQERDQVRAVFQKLMRGEVEPVEYFENAVLTASGEKRIVAWHNSVLKDPAGRIVGSLSSGQDITERVQAEAQKETALGALRERVKELTCLYAVNRDMQQSLSVDELCQRAVEHLVPAMQFPEITVPVIELNDKRFKAGPHTQELGPSLQAEIRVAGEVRGSLWVYYTEERPFLVPEEQDLIDGVAIAISSWIERVQAEAQREAAFQTVKESEERFRQVVFSISDHIYVTELTQRGELVNRYLSPHLEGLTGYPLEKFLADWHFWSATLVHPKDKAIAAAQAQKLLQGQDSEAEYRLVRADEETIWVRDSARVESLDSNTKLIYGVVSDITQRKQADRALQASEKRYRLLFDEMLSGFALHQIICDDAGQPVDYRFLEVNPAFERLTDLEARELIGKTVRQILPETEAHWIQTYGRVALSGEPAYITNYAQALDKHFEVTAFSPQPGQFATIFNDVTERMRANQALERYAQELARSNAELQRFFYVASHHLQEPLRMVTSYTQLLKKRYGRQLDADADAFIAYAVDGATYMKALIDDLLTYSQLYERGRAFERVDCDAILSETLARFKPTIEASGATITHDPLPTLWADRSQLAQVFHNLIDNALKFYPEAEPPRVHVWAEQVSAPQSGRPQYRFGVRDNGVGIQPAHAERIFDLFERLHTRDQYPGTGIGLAICKKVIQRHGGRIWVESQLNQGASFYFTLPVEPVGTPWEQTGE